MVITPGFTREGGGVKEGWESATSALRALQRARPDRRTHRTHPPRPRAPVCCGGNVGSVKCVEGQSTPSACASTSLCAHPTAPQPTALATAPISPTLPPPVWFGGWAGVLHVCRRCMGRQAGRQHQMRHPGAPSHHHELCAWTGACKGWAEGRTLAREHARTVHQPHALVCHECALESVRRRVYMIYWKAAALRRGCCAEEGPCV